MRAPVLLLWIGGKSYRVIERAGFFKADMQGYFGWTSVWADSSPTLERRIKQVRSGGQ